MSHSDDDDPLKELEIDRDKYDRERMADVLKQLVRIDQETGEPVKMEYFDDLDSRRRIVALLLARRAAHSLDLISESEVGMTSGELSDHAGAAGSTIRRYASDKLSFVENESDNSGYYIPRHKIKEAVDFLEEGKNN